MSRLDQEREARLQPKRMASCSRALERMGFEVKEIGGTEINFVYKGNTIKFWPYSGWFSGKGLEQGRGFRRLLKQLEVESE